MKRWADHLSSPQVNQKVKVKLSGLLALSIIHITIVMGEIRFSSTSFLHRAKIFKYEQIKIKSNQIICVTNLVLVCEKYSYYSAEKYLSKYVLHISM